MKDIYVVVPKGSRVIVAADDFQLAAMQLAGPGMESDLYEVINVDMLERDDDEE